MKACWIELRGGGVILINASYNVRTTVCGDTLYKFCDDNHKLLCILCDDYIKSISWEDRDEGFFS